MSRQSHGREKHTKGSNAPQSNQNNPQTNGFPEAERNAVGDTNDQLQNPAIENAQTPFGITDSPINKGGAAKHGFVESILHKFGYLRKECVSSYLADFMNKMIDEEMTDKEFAKKSLEEQFDCISIRIREILTNNTKEIQSKNVSLDGLRTEIDGLKEVKIEKDTLQQEKEKLNIENSQLQLQISSKESDIQKLKDDSEKLKSEYVKFKSAIEIILNKQTSVDSLEEDVSKFNDEFIKLTRLEQKHEEINSKCQRLEGELSTLTDKYNRLDETHKGLETVYTALEKSHYNLKENYNLCKERCDELETSEVGVLSKTITEKEKELATERKNVENYKKIIEGKDTEIVSLAEQGKNDSAKIEQQKLEVEKLGKTVTEKENELATERKNVENYKKIIQGKDTEINGLTEQGKKDSAKIEQQKLEVEKLSKTITEKENELATERKNVENYKKIIESKDTEIVGLAEQGKKDSAKIEQQKLEVEKLGKTVTEKENELATERKNVENYKKIIEGKDSEINGLTEQGKKDSAKIEQLKKELGIKQAVVDERDMEIVKLNTANKMLQGQISSLNTEVVGLEQDKVNLTNAKSAAEQLTKEKTNFINAERDAYAQSMMALAECLIEASSKEFLGSCDEAFEENRISLQEKVLKPIRAFARELAEINPDNYSSQRELEESYHAVVKEYLDATSGLTRIAQWYAYSCIPFMVDENRSDGLFIRHKEIKNMYSLASKLLGMVGMEFLLPILYVEHLPEDNTYDDVTGQRQLNIEYMCPTARSHKEHIDCIDISSIIIDVVEVGYTDDKGNRKKSQVIL